MGEWLKNNPIGSQFINFSICLLLVIVGVLYVKVKYFNIAIDTNERIRNVEKYIVPDSLVYSTKDNMNYE